MIHSRLDIATNMNTGWLGASRSNGEPVHLEPSSMDVHLGDEIAYKNDETLIVVTDLESSPEYRYAGAGDFGIFMLLDPVY